MATTGEIKSLYTDINETKAIFPRTKVRAITDDNGVGLEAILADTAYVGPRTGYTATAPVNAETLAGRPATDFATQSFVTNKIAEAQLEGANNIDLSGYVTKDEAYTTEGSLREALSAKAPRRLVSNTVTLYTTEQLELFIKEQIMTVIPNGTPYGDDGSYVLYFYIMAGEDGLEGPNGVMFQTGSLLTICRGPFNNNDTGVYSVSVTLEDCVRGHRIRYCSSFSPGLPPILNNEPIEWEWESPYMVPDIEYRTTERWNGRPVYIMQCDNLGPLPNNTASSYFLPLPDRFVPVSYEAYAWKDNRNTEWLFPVLAPGVATGGGLGFARVGWENDCFRVESNFNLSNYNLRMVVKYTK